MDNEDKLVEVKSSKHAHTSGPSVFASMENLLQTAVNGSESILGCCFDESQCRLLDVVRIATDEMMCDLGDSFAAAGQHVRLMLRKVVEFCQQSTKDHSVWQLTFDVKLPKFCPSRDVQVLPLGLE